MLLCDKFLVLLDLLLHLGMAGLLAAAGLPAAGLVGLGAFGLLACFGAGGGVPSLPGWNSKIGRNRSYTLLR